MTSVVKSKGEIIEILLKNRNDLHKYGAKRLGLFGSFVRNEQTDSSDLDLLVEFAVNKKNYDNFIALNYLLEELFNRDVELITEKSLSPHIKPYILKEVEYVEISD